MEEVHPIKNTFLSSQIIENAVIVLIAFSFGFYTVLGGWSNHNATGDYSGIGAGVGALMFGVLFSIVYFLILKFLILNILAKVFPSLGKPVFYILGLGSIVLLIMSLTHIIF